MNHVFFLEISSFIIIKNYIKERSFKLINILLVFHKFYLCEHKPFFKTLYG